MHCHCLHVAIVSRAAYGYFHTHMHATLLNRYLINESILSCGGQGSPIFRQCLLAVCVRHGSIIPFQTRKTYLAFHCAGRIDGAKGV